MMKHTGLGWVKDFKSVAADQMKWQNNRIIPGQTIGLVMLNDISS